MIFLDLETTPRNGLVRCGVFSEKYSSGIKGHSIEDIAKELARRLIVKNAKTGQLEQVDTVYVDVTCFGIALANELEARGVKVQYAHAKNIDLWLPRDRIVEETTDGDSDLWRKSFV